MSVCTFDNPDTMARECWQDGRLIAHYKAELYFLPVWPVPAANYFFGANIGHWKIGQLVGDIAAITTPNKKER